MSNTNLTANEPRNSSPTSINRRNARLCDLVNLVLGLVLISTPWLFGIAPGTQATALIGGGAAIIILSLAALTRFAVWEEWLNLLVSLWLIISPVLLHFERIEAARLQITVGIIVAAFAFSEMRFRSQAKLS
ncbi:MAG TPA: SPW repeat protein [Xanthobacteraceae bacterium]|nr:SPW repeat protein [Xanthobacteraceae bacterium]